MISRFRLFLGPERFTQLLVLLGTTGIASIVFSFIGGEASTTAQTFLAAFFILGAVWIIAGRVDADTRNRWLAVVAPALGLVILGILFVPDQIALLLGAAFGWTLVGMVIFGRTQMPMQYRLAIKAMRKNNYDEAVEAMDDLIKIEADVPNHYRFRAELLRLWGKLGRARRDYERMAELAPDSAVAYNGLAEVDLQAGKFEPALVSAQKASELAPDEWVAHYNLGMIQDRLNQSEPALESLQNALKTDVPDSRHRLLIHFYRLRAHLRLQDADTAQAVFDEMDNEKGGLKEWKLIMEDEQAATLRAVLESDVKDIEALMNNDITLEAYGKKVRS